MKKITFLIITFILFLIFCFVLSSRKLKNSYSDFKEDISFEENLKFDLTGILNLDSTIVDSNILTDKVTLVQFSFNGCSPCQKAKKRFPRLLNQTGEKFQIITISIDKFGFWKRLNKHKNRKRWTRLNIGNSDLIKSLKIIGYPTYFLLNENGEIISRPSHFVGINAVRNYFEIKPNMLDLVVEDISNLRDNNRLRTYVLGYTFIYLIFFGLIMLVRYLIKKYVG